jgi:hypothetical protein
VFRLLPSSVVYDHDEQTKLPISVHNAGCEDWHYTCRLLGRIQKRNEYKSRLLNPEAATKLATKAQQWNHLSNELLQQRRRLFGSGGYTVSSSQSDDVKDKQQKPVSAEMLLSLTENPDPSHLWNIRREMLLYVPITEVSNEDQSLSADVSQSSSSTATTSIDIIAELELTAHCLQRNPKSYIHLGIIVNGHSYTT